MTKVVALQTWSNGTITMDEKSVLDIDDALATDLIAKGIVADAATYFGGGGSGGGVLVVNMDENSTLDKTWQEIHDGGFGVIKGNNEQGVMYMPIIEVFTGLGKYGVTVILKGEPVTTIVFSASSASGYPAYSE